MQLEDINRIVDRIRQHPNEWVFADYVATHTPSGVSIWLSGIPVVDTYIWSPGKVSLPWRVKWKLYFALRDAKRAIAIDRLLASKPKEQCDEGNQ